MQRGALVGILFAAVSGCAKLDMPVEQGADCARSIVLDGSVGGSTTVDVDLGSTEVCMQLDATKNLRSAHLMITVDAVNVHSKLVDQDEVPLRDGWDVQVSNRTSHVLEWSLEAGEIRDVALHVARTGAVAPTQLKISLYEPFE